MSFWDSFACGLTSGLYNLSNICYSYGTSRFMQNAGISAFDTLYVNLDSPTGFSSWINPYYASRQGLALESAGLDSRNYATSSAITTSIYNSIPFTSYCYNPCGYGGFSYFC